MSVHEQAAAAILSQIALAADGAVLGLALAYVAVRSILKFTGTSSALKKISKAPYVSVSDLRSVLSSGEDSDSSNDAEGGKLVLVRGVVEAKSAVDGTWTSFKPNVLVSHESGDRGVILMRTQTIKSQYLPDGVGSRAEPGITLLTACATTKCIYNEWRGLFGWTSDLRSLFARSWKERESSSLRTVPFVLVDGGRRHLSDYVVVNMDGSRHPLPLMTVYHQLQPITASPYTLIQALFGREYPVGLLDEEKILALGKEITAVGILSLKDGIIEVKSCKELPYFLSEMTKDKMVVDLAFKTKLFFWSGTLLSALSIGILGYAAVRNWNRWKVWREERREARQRNLHPDNANPQDDAAAEEEDVGEVPDGQLCVICLMRRRRSAFVPCGHLVCCQPCALSVARDMAPKCPLCRQAIRSSVRIYDS